MRGSKRCRQRQAYTLLEIMIVVAFIGLLAVLAIPGFIKARKQSQARRIINDIRVIDGAINAWALEQGKSDGAAVDLPAAATYTKTGTINPNDVLGNPYDISAGVGPSQIVISVSTKDALSGVAIDWGGY